MTIGEKLVKARGNQTQEAVSAAVGISRSAIQMYEANMRVPRDAIKVALSNYYGIPVQDLFFSPNDT